jgi:TolA-binding protein
MANSTRNKPGSTPVDDDGIKKLEHVQFLYEKNKKGINTALIVVVVLIAGFFGYQRLYQAPRETKAANAIYHAQRYFDIDSVGKALNGDGQHAGFLKVIKSYSGTSAANLSEYYAGICYLKMGDLKNATKHLEAFNGKGTMVEKVAQGSLGDAYMESGNTQKGIDAYRNATASKPDMLLTPLYLFRLGAAYELNNKPDEAKKAYKRIRDEYPTSMQAREIDKYLARLGEVE